MVSVWVWAAVAVVAGFYFAQYGVATRVSRRAGDSLEEGEEARLFGAAKRVYRSFLRIFREIVDVGWAVAAGLGLVGGGILWALFAFVSFDGYAWATAVIGGLSAINVVSHDSFSVIEVVVAGGSVLILALLFRAVAEGLLEREES